MEAVIGLIIAPLVQHIKKAWGLKDYTVLLISAVLCTAGAGIYLFAVGQVPAVTWPLDYGELSQLASTALVTLLTASGIYLLIWKKLDGQELPPSIFDEAQVALVKIAAVFGIELKQSAGRPPLPPTTPNASA